LSLWDTEKQIFERRAGGPAGTQKQNAERDRVFPELIEFLLIAPRVFHNLDRVSPALDGAAKVSPSCKLEAGEIMPATTQDEVLTALKDCYDPEIPVNIVDLGLIYGIKIDPAENDQQDITVDMTLTAQGCPEHVTIGEQVKGRVQQIPGVRTVNVNVVWEPAWTPERLSPEARKQLGIE